jgi:1-deoxy-D-xylulose-5-phosphate reductoisomerase
MARRRVIGRALDLVAMRQVSLFGATGTIGDNTLDLMARHADRFSLLAASADGNVGKLADIARRFNPSILVIGDEAGRAKLVAALPDFSGDIWVGADGLAQMAQQKCDIAIMGIVGFAGLAPSIMCARQGGALALANKEALVAGGRQLMRVAAQHGTQILPVDSEHNAVFQLLQGPGDLRHVDKIVLTASGGPFREMSYEEMRAVTPAQAVAHPNWDMGAKISVDSATMMNKGLELIEARHLFDVPPEKLDALIHPQSIVHGLVYFADGSVLAQKGSPDMRVPLAYCMAYPERIDAGVAPLDLAAQGRLDFAAIDRAQFPCLALAEAAMRADGSAPARLNAANEVAVAAFLEGRIGFLQIAETVDAVLQKAACEGGDDVAALPAIDAEARAQARDIIAAF